MRRFATTAALLSLIPTAAFAVPTTVSHQGRLMNSQGTPLDGPHDVVFELFDSPASGSSLWSETRTVQFANGYYSVDLGSTSALDEAVFRDLQGYLSIAVDGNAPLGTRLELRSVPYAVIAGNVSGGIVDASEIRVNGTTVIDGSGEVVFGIPSDLDAVTTIGGAAISTGVHFADADAVSALAPHTSDAAAHHTAFVAADAISALAPHTSDAAAHHTAFVDSDAVSALAPHTSDAAAHHTAFVDSDAVSALVPHTSDAGAHHTAYTDADAVAALASDFDVAGRNDSRVSFVGAWTDSNGWGVNRYAPSQAKYTDCSGNVDCSAQYIELDLAGNTHRSVLMSHLDWTNTYSYQVLLSFDAGASWRHHSSVGTHSSNSDSTPYTSTIRTLATNLPLGADVRLRIIAAKGRLHFEGFGLSTQNMGETDSSPFRQISWASGASSQDTCNVTGTCFLPVPDRTLTFVKTDPNTAVRVQYNDNMRTYSGDSVTAACRWYVRFDGNACPSGDITGDVYAASYDTSNKHAPRTVAGYCTGLAADTYTIQVYVGNAPGYTRSRCYTGWTNQKWLLEIEEVR